MKWKFTLPALLLLGCMAFSQEYFPKNDGVKAENDNYTALTGATLHLSPSETVSGATLLIRRSEVVAAGTSVRIPENSVVIDLDGKHIYPSFIDVFSDYGIEKPKRARGSGRSSQYDPTREGYYWNDHIRAEQDAVGSYSFDKKEAASLRKLGFGVVNSHIADGIARGTGVTLALNEEGNEGKRILQDEAGQYFSFEKSVTSRQSYPTSLMGAMALLRQVYHDAEWYAEGHASTTDRSLEALLENKGLTQFFAADDHRHIPRADGIGDAFGIQYVIRGGGREYENVAEVKASGATVVIPLNFPAAFDVSNPYQAGYITLEDMRHWNQAPSNPKVMADNDIPFAFTLHGLKKRSDFHKKIRKAMEYGLTETQALQALTTVPAALLGQSDQIGSLRPGRLANFLVTSGPVFDENTTLYENWVRGQRHILADLDQQDIRGAYTLNTGGGVFSLEITGKADAPKAKVKKDTAALSSKLSYSGDWMDLSFSDGDDRYRMTARVSGDSDILSGKAVLPGGRETSFTARKTEAFEDSEGTNTRKSLAAPEILPVTYPNVGYGFRDLPAPEDVLFRNATVWTSEDAGILEDTDVLIRDGKIARIGQGLKAGRAKVIDATGKHLTAGIIDEHSHIAALDINEAGHNSSAEVKMADVIDAKDMNIYRNLAGGVTTIQLLHGSANPIGGRSAVLRLKWGKPASELPFEDMPKFIKFALGENVKQSNWGGYIRFPQTRMGVEQVFLDYFRRAREYEEKKASGQPYRYDEEMEVLAEILNGERFISCHSYVQSEINMLMKVAEKMGFRVNTFTHILEGYKVADKMAEHGVGGSTFSDWWAYKYEVKDAIPYNAAIMHNAGVTVAINSDDAEMSRRLNQEAAKTVKYGGMSEEEAWKTVTINPAKLLHLDDRVGSIAEGKEADVVLWSGHPMSVYSRAEKTYIQGVPYFDIERDTRLRQRIAEERNTLINMMLQEKDGGAKRTPSQKKKELMHCNTL